MNTALRFCSGAMLVAVVGLAAPAARGADTLQMDTGIAIDRLGDGQLSVTFRLSASQWTVWRQQYGDRPDVLWRDMRQQFASMALSDFSLEKNDVERTAIAKFTVRGGTQLRSDGAHEIELPKNMTKISESGRDWIFNSVAQENPYAPILNQTIRVTLPAEAVNVRLNQPGTAFQALVYDIPAEGGNRQVMLFTGIGALVLGLLLAVLGFLPGKKTEAAAAA